MMYREIGLKPPLLLYWIFTAVQELMLELAGILSLVSQAQEQWPHVVPPWLTWSAQICYSPLLEKGTF